MSDSVNDIHAQLHTAADKRLRVPAHVNVVGFERPPGLTAAAIKKHFASALDSSGYNSKEIVWLPDTAFLSAEDSDGSLMAKLSIAADHYTYEVWSMPFAGQVPEFGRITKCGALLTAPPKVTQLTNLDISISDLNYTTEQITQLLSEGIEIMAGVTSAGLHFATNYEPDHSGMERYLIWTDKSALSPAVIESAVGAVVDIENSFHLLARPNLDYPDAVERLARIDAHIARQLAKVSKSVKVADTRELREWLQELTGSFAELAAMSEAWRRRFSTALEHKDRLVASLRLLAPTTIGSFNSIDEPLRRRATGFAANYASLLKRIEAVREQASDVIALLQTRIDLLQRDQSFALQCSMHKTTKTQVAMQRSIEGLYIFIVAFYLTELARLVFEALHERDLLPYSPSILAAAVIPLALLLGFILSGKAKHLWQKMRPGRGTIESDIELSVGPARESEVRGDV